MKIRNMHLGLLAFAVLFCAPCNFWNVDYMLMGFGFLYYRETIKGIFASAKETMSMKSSKGKGTRNKG